jgi:hypothetical protein
VLDQRNNITQPFQRNNITQPFPHTNCDLSVIFLLVIDCRGPGVQYIDLFIIFVDNINCPVQLIADGHKYLCKK